MTGIILKTKLKSELTIDEVTQGALGRTTDTDELVCNHIGDLKYRKVKTGASEAVSKNDGTPSGGQNGDLVLNSSLGENIDFFKIVNWTPRYEGYDEAYLLENFEPRVNPPTPDDYIRVDGSTLMTNGYANSTNDSVVTKGFIDILAATLNVNDIIKTDGSIQMIPSYTPTLEYDVINLSYLSSGQMVIIPPTTIPSKSGVIWNNDGVPKVSTKVSMRVWSSQVPTPVNLDIISDNGDGSWTVGSNNTTFNFNEDANITKIEVFALEGISSLNESFLRLTGMTEFVCPFELTENVTDFTSTWFQCGNLTSFPLIDTSSGTNFSSTWNNCSSLTSFPLLDTSSGTTFARSWEFCSSLTSFPSLNVSSGTDFSNTWRGCSSLPYCPAGNEVTIPSGAQTYNMCLDVP